MKSVTAAKVFQDTYGPVMWYKKNLELLEAFHFDLRILSFRSANERKQNKENLGFWQHYLRRQCVYKIMMSSPAEVIIHL